MRAVVVGLLLGLCGVVAGCSSAHGVTTASVPAVAPSLTVPADVLPDPRPIAVKAGCTPTQLPFTPVLGNYRAVDCQYPSLESIEVETFADQAAVQKQLNSPHMGGDAVIAVTGEPALVVVWGTSQGWTGLTPPAQIAAAVGGRVLRSS